MAEELGADETVQTGFYVTFGMIPASIFVYQISRPGENGELSSLHRWFEKISDYGSEWETKNTLMTAALEQASHDKHLLYGAGRSQHHELKYPEYVLFLLFSILEERGSEGARPVLLDEKITDWVGLGLAWAKRGLCGRRGVGTISFQTTWLPRGLPSRSFE